MFYEKSLTKSKIVEEELKPEEQPKFEEKDMAKPDYKFVPGNHLWKQEGYYLVCYGCELSHAVWIGEDKLMVGVDSNGPIVKTRKELGMV
jgi:hypothetical protein